MRRCLLHLGVAVAVMMAAAPALHAQQNSKAPAKTAVRPAAPAQPAALSGAANEDITSSIGAIGSNWRVECSVQTHALECRAVQEVVTSKDRQLVAGLVVRVPAETKKPVMMIQMPLGVLVSEGVDLAVDEGKPERFNVQTCNQQGCFVGATVSDPLLAAMRGGKHLKILFRNANKQAVTVTMPLDDFGLVYDKVKG